MNRQHALWFAPLLSLAALLNPCRAGSLYDAMGGTPVLQSAVDKFTDIVIADPRINFTFAEADLAKFKKLLFEQLCELSGGPCKYSGRDIDRKSVV